VRSLESQGLPLGVEPSPGFGEGELELGPGDLVFAFTDGLVEARRGDELFERERVIESLISHASQGLTPRALAKAVYDDAKEFGTVTDDTVVFAIGCGFDSSA
jgi:serine phosphatase RsbU (regulator of sigma subunit)